MPESNRRRSWTPFSTIFTCEPPTSTASTAGAAGSNGSSSGSATISRPTASVATRLSRPGCYPGGSIPAASDASARDASGIRSAAPTRKPIAPRKVPLFARPRPGARRSTGPRRRRSRRARRRSSPPRLRAAITHPRSCGRHESQRCPASAKASQLATRKQTEPSASGARRAGSPRRRRGPRSSPGRC